MERRIVVEFHDYSESQMIAASLLERITHLVHHGAIGPKTITLEEVDEIPQG